MPDGRPAQAPEYEMTEGTPEFYVDALNVETQLYGSSIYLGRLRPGQPQKVLAVVKMSPPMAKVLSLILNKHVKNYERDLGAIPLPKGLLHNLGLEELI